MSEARKKDFGDQSWEAWKDIDPADMHWPESTQTGTEVTGSEAVSQQGVVVPYAGKESSDDLPCTANPVDPRMRDMLA